jgi:hypothetical protein
VDARRDFGPETTRQRSLLHDDCPPGRADHLDQSVDVERNQRTQVEHGSRHAVAARVALIALRMMERLAVHASVAAASPVTRPGWDGADNRPCLAAVA